MFFSALLKVKRHKLGFILLGSPECDKQCHYIWSNTTGTLYIKGSPNLNLYIIIELIITIGQTAVYRFLAPLYFSYQNTNVL